MNTLVYLVYGANREYQLELTYSVLSAMHWAAGSTAEFRIAVVTDVANRRADLPVETVTFSPTEFAMWTRNGLFPHEAKIHAIMKALDLFRGKVALVDTDTYFLRNPRSLFDRIAPGASVMHAYEGVLGTDRLLSPVLQKVRHESLPYPLSAATRLFNSGVIGLHYADRPLLDDVLPLLDEIYRVYPAFTIEQFVVSVVLGQRTSLAESVDLIRHYYGHERGFIHARIADLFPQFTADAFQRHLPMLPKVDGFAKKRILDLIRARLKAAMRGQGSEYRFAYLAYRSALSNAYRSPTMANVWALIAALVLRQNEFSLTEIEKDFALMGRPEVFSWANEDTRRAWTIFWEEFRQARERGQRKTTATAWLV